MSPKDMQKKNMTDYLRKKHQMLYSSKPSELWTKEHKQNLSVEIK